ncbi:hypothetical protein SM0020_25646 [Sinorhizobium meliloti CCNWSX0020]|uniref:Uncharacterized protein n=1 Tax=Sinorhizobium meliloti CCNWSX0020 TaxID=1107881 RepID=H0G6K5_RHIML|nr:hypothetical protein SM0020_25646 [Sinorhizobium meliloti CCNWSX0020]
MTAPKRYSKTMLGIARLLSCRAAVTSPQTRAAMSR